MELTCAFQTYDWGKKGNNSRVGSMVENVNETIKIEPNKSYAEYWMGNHPNGPSKIKETGESLGQVLENNPDYLGSTVLKRFGLQLPFLFKVLSIEKALSIQAHPSKRIAEQLHATYPEVYKDSNYKPEMAIALTEFEALVGFRPACEIRAYCQVVPELKILTESFHLIRDDLAFVKKAFCAILTSPRDVIATLLEKLLNRLRLAGQDQRLYENAELVELLHSQYPGDAGVFMVFFMNYILLKPYEAIFLNECEPHAYIYGDCIECMACSDNVVRAGLTPKLIDVETLCSMLSYRSLDLETAFIKPEKEDDFTVIYRPPVPDFAVALIKVPASPKPGCEDYCPVRSYTLKPRPSASILIIISGTAKTAITWNLKPGTVYFVPANKAMLITDFKNELEMCQAFVNV